MKALVVLVAVAVRVRCSPRRRARTRRRDLFDGAGVFVDNPGNLPGPGALVDGAAGEPLHVDRVPRQQRPRAARHPARLARPVPRARHRGRRLGLRGRQAADRGRARGHRRAPVRARLLHRRRRGAVRADEEAARLEPLADVRRRVPLARADAAGRAHDVRRGDGTVRAADRLRERGGTPASTCCRRRTTTSSRRRTGPT